MLKCALNAELPELWLLSSGPTHTVGTNASAIGIRAYLLVAASFNIALCTQPVLLRIYLFIEIFFPSLLGRLEKEL